MVKNNHGCLVLWVLTLLKLNYVIHNMVIYLKGFYCNKHAIYGSMECY